MLRVNIYIMSDCVSPRKSKKNYGYVMECEIKGQIVTRTGFGCKECTYHQAILQALIESLERFNQTCQICIYSEDEFVLNMIDNNLHIWAGKEFKTSKGKPVANQEEWMEVWRLSKGHMVLIQPGKHSYSSWLLEEMDRRKEKQDE